MSDKKDPSCEKPLVFTATRTIYSISLLAFANGTTQQQYGPNDPFNCAEELNIVGSAANIVAASITVTIYTVNGATLTAAAASQTGSVTMAGPPSWIVTFGQGTLLMPGGGAIPSGTKCVVIAASTFDSASGSGTNQITATGAADFTAA